VNGARPSDGNELGERLRAERERQAVGVRELSRRVNISASMISQIELGRVMPSVSTLYAITSALGISLDDLFAPADGGLPPPPPASAAPPVEPVRAGSPLQRAGDHKTISLASGVRWELLTTEPDPDVEFLQTTYDVGGESAPADALMRHGGTEYGVVIDGRLGVTVGFETFTLEPGDSISFDSSIPHRLFNMLTDRPTRAIWVVVGRRGDTRFQSSR
jgi:DNA-binding XRE family transcriptional regulator/mannose-6-phosphate isomerase-like protein (cupin superfamily)